MSNTRTARIAVFAFSLFALVGIIALSSAPAMAQATTGTLRGTVLDQNGAVVAGAAVKAKSEATGTEVGTTTSGDGVYEISNLVPGKYTVTIEGTNFKRSVTNGVDVKVGIVNSLDTKLEPGSVNETVTVTAAAEEVLNTDQAQISHSFEARKVAELPSNSAGGGLDTIALLIPGVAQNSGGGTNTNGTGLSVNGNRGRSNNFQIDGADNNDLSVGGPNLFIDNQDAVQEYQVITNNFSAQYGRNLGAVVNIVGKSGTNEFHGSAFEFHRDQHKLDTLNNIERARGDKEPARFLSNVFGGTVGGPIWKNHAFFFGAYEGIRQPSTSDVVSGGLAINAADLPKLTAAFPGNNVIAAIVAMNPSVLPLGTVQPRSDLNSCNATTLKAVNPTDPNQPWKLCNRDFIDFTNPNTGVTQRVEGFLIERLFPTPYTQNEWSVRGDMKVTSRDNFYVRYYKQNGVTKNSTQVSSTAGEFGDVGFDTKNLGGSYFRQISSRAVNEFRATRTNLFVSFGGGCDPKTLGCVPNSSQIDNSQIEVLNITGVTGVTLTGNALRAMGTTGGLPQGRDTTLYDFADNLSMTRGRHSLVMGAEVKYTNAHVPFLPNYGGSFTFNSQQRVFNNAPSAASIALGNPNVPYTEIDQYYFVQDDWKIRPNLTLNLGVRYEYTGQPINDLSENTRTRESGAKPFWNPALPIEQRIVPLTKPDENNFAPRFGFAWVPKFGGKEGFMHRLLGEDATVIRGGYAIAYDPAFYNILLNVANSSPFSIALAASAAQLPATSPVIQLPGSLFGADIRTAIVNTGVLAVGKLDPKWLGQTVVAKDFRSPYSQQWSFGIQRSIGKNYIAEVRYVGNHGVGLFQSVLQNPFIGVAGNYVLQPGVPTTAVGLPIATTPCSVGGSNTAGQLPNCIGGFFGFTRNITTSGGTVAVNFPSYASKLAPGAVGLSCVDNAATLDNEGACNGRILARGAITSRDNRASSNYNSLQARFNGRLLHNSLNLGAAYTFSKTIDDSSEVFAFNGESSIFPQNAFDNQPERSVSALHRPHIFSMNGIYDVPFMKEQRGFLGKIFGGWQINATHVINSGRRYTAGQNQNAARLGNGPSYVQGGSEALRPFYGNPKAPQNTVAISQVDAFLYGKLTTVTNLNGFISLNALNNGSVVAVNPTVDTRFIYNGPYADKLFGTPFGDVPRYSLVGPILNQTNLGIFKNTKVMERLTVQLRGEFFNVWNHPNIGYGVTRISSLPPSELIDNAGLASSEFGNNARINLARRVVQVGIRFIF